MRMRQEQVVFLVCVVVLGYSSWRLFGDGPSRRSRRSSSAEPAVFADHRAPAVDVALSRGDQVALTRELFVPPRDTRPLAPLELLEPPRHSLPALLPPSVPGPAARAFGRLLRRSIEPVELPDLFAESDLASGSDAQERFLDLAGEEGQGGLEALREAAGSESRAALETPAQRVARNAGYRGRFDWVRRSPLDTIYGRIVNEDRFGLAGGG